MVNIVLVVGHRLVRTMLGFIMVDLKAVLVTVPMDIGI